MFFKRKRDRKIEMMSNDLDQKYNHVFEILLDKARENAENGDVESTENILEKAEKFAEDLGRENYFVKESYEIRKLYK